jgi:LysM repeat protein
MSQKKKSSYTVKAIEDFDSSVLAEEIVAAIENEELPVEIIQPVAPTKVHVVVAGDTLSSIAAKYCPAGLTIDQFYRQLNVLNDRPAVAKGQVIKLFGDF